MKEIEKVRQAIIITEDHYNGLGMIRSLGETGNEIALLILTESPKTYIDKSKYVGLCLTANHNEDAIFEALQSMIAEKCLNYLFPLSDYAALCVDKFYDKFSANVIVPNRDGNLLECEDKSLLKHLAEESGFLVPKGQVYRLNDSSLDWDTFPAIIKPVASVEGRKSDITTVNNLNELKAAISVFKNENYDRVLIEQFITGQEEHMVEVMGYTNSERCPVVCGIVQKIREYPVKNGSTAFAKLVPTHDGLDFACISQFFSSLHFYGLFDMEFKYAAGKLYFIECNFRNGAPGYALTHFGYNIPLLWMNDVAQIELSDINSDAIFMFEQNDLISMLKGDVRFFTWIKQYLTSFKAFKGKHDFKPVWHYYKNFLIDRLGKRGNHK